MPRNGSGTYSLPAGNPVVAGDVIEASWANTTLADVANELTNSLSRNGNGGMLAPFRVADGSVSAPGLGFTNETNTGLYRAGSGEIWLTVGGIAVAQLTVNGMLIPAGKRITLPAPVNDTDATNKEYVDDLVNPVIQYANYYLGPKSSDPLVNNSGGALTAGTTYWSTTLDQMRVYNGTNWEPMPSTSSLVGQTFSGTGAQTAFTMANPSGPAVNLEVFISGVRQVPTTDYTVSNNILTFTSAPPVGTNNIFIRYAQLMQSSGNLQTVVQNITATAGQTAFSLSSSYQPGTNNLGVYVNGLRLVPGTDYTETSSTTLTMASGATAGDEFMFVIGDEISESISSVNVSYTPAGTGAVATSVQTKLRETVSVKDFGAVGDGVTDDTAAIQAAVAYINTSGGGTLIFDGQYNLGTNTSGTITKFNLTTSNVTLMFRKGTKFTITSDNNLAIIFLLSGVSNVFMEGVLHVEGAVTTTYSTTGIYGPRAVDIRNASGGECGNIHIEAVRLIRGAAAVVVSSDYTSNNRVNGVTIGDVYTEDVTYGINCANNGDNVSCNILTTKNAYRSWFAYGCRGHTGAIRSYSHYTGGTPVNLSRFSAAEGGSNTNTEAFDLTVDVVDASANVTCATLRHIGDGGASASIQDVAIRISANVLNTGLTAVSLLNYASSGGALTATSFAATINNVHITANIPDTINTIYRDVCTWTTKPTITFDGTLQLTLDTQLVLAAVLDLVAPVPGSWTAFTPTLVGTTTAGTGTYTTQSGSYCRIGKTIFFTISLSWSAHTGTGNMRLSGLPYASSGTATTRTYTVWTNNIALTAGNIATSVHGAGTTNITLQQMPTGGGGVTSIPMDTAGDIVVSGFYPL